MRSDLVFGALVQISNRYHLLTELPTVREIEYKPVEPEDAPSHLHW